MKTQFLKLLFSCFFIASCCYANAQTNKPAAVKKQMPDSFSISKTDFDKLFLYKTKSVVKNSSNKYLDRSIVLLNSSYGSNKQLKLQLKAFANAFLVVQINGEDSKLIFITSSDKSVFYMSKTYADKFTMVKCAEDDIVSE